MSLGYNSSASINNSCAYGSSAVANMNNCVSIGDSSTTASYFCTSIGQNSYSQGQGSVALGCNAGKNNSNSQNSNMNFCTYIGSNTGCDVSNSTYTYATCIGAGSVISSSASIQLGRPGDTTTASNINTTNLTATTATINNLNINGTTTFNYSSLSGLSSFKNQGFSSTSSNLKNIYAYETFYNCNTITLPCGVYFINYKFDDVLEKPWFLNELNPLKLL